MLPPVELVKFPAMCCPDVVHACLSGGITCALGEAVNESKAIF
jgi:hypothetical protein